MSVLLSFIIFIALLLVLFFLSRFLTKTLYLLFFLFTNNQKTSIHLLAYFLIPGTLVHEISHLFMAGILGVPTGELSIIPKIEDKEVKTGTLKIAKVDPFRRTLIGLAPILVGSSLTVFITHFLFKIETLEFEGLVSLFKQPLNLVFCYLLIVISLSMFSSRKDLEMVFIPLFIFACFSMAFYLGDFKLQVSEKILKSSNSLLENLNKAFFLAAWLELILFVITKSVLFALKKIKQFLPRFL